MSEWNCPYCGRAQLTTGKNIKESFVVLDIGETNQGKLGLGIVAARCLNPECNKITLSADLASSTLNSNGYTVRDPASGPFEVWNLRPSSSARPQPDFIPAVLRRDYEEACSIVLLSPKASATLSRRCLQGMIRDFTKISKDRLIDEIKELRKRVDDGSAPKGVEAETIEAIDAVRSIGNIGAHMEKDIDHIVEVDAGEAQALIGLIEMLFEDWYVARHDRQQRLAKVKEIASQKAEAKQKNKPVGVLPEN